MKALFITEFGKTPTIENLLDPRASELGVVIEVKASGICRSDWHGWMGHDHDIKLPHVPGHELAGVVAEIGKGVHKWRVGDRVTLPFSCACGSCQQCNKGDHQICDNYFQPGFTAWGSFAEYVQIDYADVNLVALPDDYSFTEAAVLGCRFGTAFRALIDQGKITENQKVAVFGCGGVGLSVIAIAKAVGAQVVAIDIQEDALIMARRFGADYCLNAGEDVIVAEQIKDIFNGGADLSVDGIGHPKVISAAVRCLAKRGKHIQIGLLFGHDHEASVDMDIIIGRELEIIGSHGIQAYRYEKMLDFIKKQKIELRSFINTQVHLRESIDVLVSMGQNKHSGVAVITDFK